jgi:hypothetical protein
MTTSVLSISPDLKLQRKQKGTALKRVDADFKMLNSGPLGAKRLLVNTSIDLQEAIPNLSDEDAQKMAIAQLMITVGAGQ